MLRILLIRGCLFLAPFAIFFLWRQIAARRGEAMGRTPWAWLVFAGASLAALSLVASSVFPSRPLTGHYVPAQIRTDGSIRRGYFVPDRQGAGP